MGRSANATIAFGIAVTMEMEDRDDLEWLDDAEAWWLKEKGWEEPFQLRTKDGYYAPGRSEKDCSAYYESKRAFLNEHPMPFEIDYFGYELECPIVIVPGTDKTVDWSQAHLVTGLIPTAHPRGERAFVEFLRSQKIDIEPDWLLTVSYG